MENLKIIKNMYTNNTKIKDIQLLKIITKYLNLKSNVTTTTINYGSNIKFNIFNIELNILHTIHVRPETIFKINCLAFIFKMSSLFKNLKIEVCFEESSTVGRNLTKIQNQYKHDVIIKCYNDIKYYEIGLEYNEKASHNNSRQINNDNVRDIKSEMFLDLYSIYNEKDNNYDKYINNLLYNILVILCSLNNDEYLLAKILYCKNKQLNVKDEEFFDLILNWKKINKIDILTLYNILVPVDESGNEYSYEDYIEHLEELQIVITDGIIDYNNFRKLVNNESNDCSTRIISFRKIQSDVGDKLTDSGKEIIKLIEKINDKKQLIIPYTDEIIKNLHTYYNQKNVELGIKNYNKLYANRIDNK